MLGPINDVTGLLPDDGLPYNVDQWDGYTADRREVLPLHQGPPRAERAVRHRRHPLRLGRRGAVRRRQLPARRQRRRWSSSARSVTSQQPQGHHRHPGRGTTSLAVEQTILANNRHIKYLNFDDHGFSVLDLDAKRAQMDWFVIGDRADKDTPITLQPLLRHHAGTNRVKETDVPLHRRSRVRADVRLRGPARARRAHAVRRRPGASSRPGVARCSRPGGGVAFSTAALSAAVAPDAAAGRRTHASGSTCSWSTAARPRRSAAARRRTSST